MPAKVFSAAIIGLEAEIIEVEADVSSGLRCFNVVGLPDKAIEESKERINAALKSVGLKSPFSQAQRVLINLAPADLKKEGALYDLPIVFSYLLASRQTSFNPQKKLFAGELALNSRLRPIKGALSLALAARRNGFEEIILPRENAVEAGLVKNFKIIGVRDLKEVLLYLSGQLEIQPPKTRWLCPVPNLDSSFDFGEIKGQESAKRALEIAASGGHNLLMIGPPGAGKTLLARATASILPELSFEEKIEVTQIYSVAGLLASGEHLVSARPFRSPHHSVSEVALIGGGQPPRPGEITLAHRGVLFLDEFPEFHRDVLESLRQPLEQGQISVLRAKHRLLFPAKFTLLAASNPCPCGYFQDPQKKCTCSPSQIGKYRRKLSGPLMDRFDIFISVPALKYEKLVEEKQKQGASIKDRVKKARQIQKQRFRNRKINAEISPAEIKSHCPVPESSVHLLKKYVNSGQLSARGFHRVLKVARTIADLEESEKIQPDHVFEALMYRLRNNDND